MFLALCFHHQEVKIVLHSVGGCPVHQTDPYRCHDTRSCIIHFWPPGDEHIVLETCTGMQKTYYKTRIFALIWSVTKIILRFRVSKTSKHASICEFTVVTHNVTIRMFNNNGKITNENNYSIENTQWWWYYDNNNNNNNKLFNTRAYLLFLHVISSYCINQVAELLIFTELINSVSFWATIF